MLKETDVMNGVSATVLLEHQSRLLTWDATFLSVAPLQRTMPVCHCSCVATICYNKRHHLYATSLKDDPQ